MTSNIDEQIICCSMEKRDVGNSVMPCRRMKRLVLVCVFLSLFYVIICSVRWFDCRVPAGYSPNSTEKLRHSLLRVKSVGVVASVAQFFGFGKSWSDSQRRITDYLVRDKHLDPGVREIDHVFDGVPVRVYEPVNRTGILPGIVWYHGGGWTLGSLDSAADTVRRLCKQTDSVVVSVNYRLAPEHVFPAAFDDCFTATKYFITNAKRFKVDSSRVAIGGDSAGGNLAAVVALRLRDEVFEPIVKLQVLIYPVTQGLNFQLPSYVKYADGPLLTRQMMAYFILTYLEGNDDKVDVLLENGHVSSAAKKSGLPFIDVSKLPSKYLVGYTKPSVDTGSETVWNEMKDKLLNPYFSPLVADRLDNLPPAYVFTAEHDPLRDEGILYAERLKDNGISVTHRHSDIGIHGIIGRSKFLPEADKCFREMTDFIIKHI